MKIPVTLPAALLAANAGIGAGMRWNLSLGINGVIKAKALPALEQIMKCLRRFGKIFTKGGRLLYELIEQNPKVLKRHFLLFFDSAF